MTHDLKWPSAPRRHPLAAATTSAPRIACTPPPSPTQKTAPPTASATTPTATATTTSSKSPSPARSTPSPAWSATSPHSMPSRKQNLLDPFDHQNLNTLAAFRDQVSTTENFTIEVFRIFKAFPDAELLRVRIEETSNNSFEYTESVEKGRTP